MTTPLTMQPWLGPFARSHLSMSEVAVVERQVENRALSVPARREADQVPEHSPGSTKAGDGHPNYAVSANTATRSEALVLEINAAPTIRAATRTEPQFPRRV